jgi:hypothetical protein
MLEPYRHAEKSIKCGFRFSQMRQVRTGIFRDKTTFSLVKCKATPVQSWTGPEGSRRLRLPDFKTIGT